VKEVEKAGCQGLTFTMGRKNHKYYTSTNKDRIKPNKKRLMVIALALVSF
jgi:hypothetical protein